MYLYDIEWIAEGFFYAFQPTLTIADHYSKHSDVVSFT